MICHFANITFIIRVHTYIIAIDAVTCLDYLDYIAAIKRRENGETEMRVDRSQINLTDEEILEAFDEVSSCSGDVSDIDEVVFTTDTIDEWIAATREYHEGGRFDGGKPSEKGFHLLKVQPLAGDRRRDLIVVKIGEFTAAYTS
jgi:hypothetical protein